MGAPHNSHYSQVLPGRLPETPPHNWHPLPVASAGPFTPGAYYAGPALVSPARHDPFQHSQPLAPPPARTPPSPLAHQQSIAEYVKRRNSVLQGLQISPEEFAHWIQTLLWGLGQKYPDRPPEDWAHRLLDFNDQGAAVRLPESVHENLQQNAFMRNELQSLINEIHVSPNPGTFKDPTDPARSFHIQRGAPSYPGDASRIPGQRNQEE
ncbi:hypothetical protein C0992_004906 [Termitomyces sp. T32_za158]|nr:hypothetical protein C0992_004906 [Termitomyces sp. T32_za158]